MYGFFSTSLHMTEKLSKVMKTKKSQKYCEHFEKKCFHYVKACSHNFITPEIKNHGTK